MAWSPPFRTSARMVATEVEISSGTDAPLQNSARSESNCFEEYESVRTAYLPGGVDGTANSESGRFSLRMTWVKVAVAVKTPFGPFTVLTMVFGKRIP